MSTDRKPTLVTGKAAVLRVHPDEGLVLVFAPAGDPLHTFLPTAAVHYGPKGRRRSLRQTQG
jgi:hypothetical protein